MVVIEHRRHTIRHKPGQHLNQEGVDIARATGRDMGPFDLVLSSSLPRALETAIAMGFGVDEQLEDLIDIPDGWEDEIAWDEGYAAFSKAVAQHPDGAVARLARSMRDLHHRVAEQLAPDGRGLLISHGLVVETSAVACLPDEDFVSWGPAADYCDGFRATFEEGRFTGGEPVRARKP